MIKECIYNFLLKKRNKKRQEVIRMQGQKAELEKIIADARTRSEEH
jgi:hypothetical protein